VFPQYEELTRLLERKGENAPKPSQQLKSSVCAVYKDLFGFFQSVVLVFMKEDGSKLLTCLDFGGL
jgi:hypothetical protein